MINKIKKLLLVATLPLLALCHTAPAQAATVIEVPVEWCDLLESIAFEVDWCNPDITIGTPTNPGTTSVSIQVTTDRDGSGTLYAYPTTSCSTAPSEATMKASGQQFPFVADTINTLITDLTPATSNYCVWYAHEWERRFSSIEKSDLFDTVGTGSTPPGYYLKVGDGCSDSNTGLSDAQAWCTIAKAEATVNGTGEDIFFRAGDTWYETFTAPVSGTPTDFAEISCYKMVSGVETRCDETDYGSSPTSNNLPKIYGPITETCLAAKNCDYSTLTDISSVFQGQVEVNLRNYVKVSYIQSGYGKGAAFRFSGVSVSDKTYNKGHVVDHIRVYKSGTHGVLFQNSAQNIYGNMIEIDGAGVCSAMTRQPEAPETTRPDNCKKTGGWGGALVITRSRNSDSLFENYKVKNAYGESTNCLTGSDVVFRNFVVSNNLSFLYPDAGDNCIFENGISIGSQGFIGYYPTERNFGGGFETNIETFAALGTGLDSKDNVVRNVAFLDSSTGLHINLQAGSRGQGRLIGAHFIHNVVVSPVGESVKSNSPTIDTDESLVMNNIFWNEDSLKAECSVTSVGKLIFSGNHWFGKTPSSKCTTGDSYVTFGNPQLSQNVYSIYDTYDYLSIPAATIVKVRPGSAAATGGDPAALTTVCIDKTKHAFAISKMGVDADDWAKCGLLDYNGEKRTGPSIVRGIFKDTL